MVKVSLTPNRDKRVEELELRLKSMEAVIKGRVSNGQSITHDVDFRNSPARPDPHSSSSQSEIGTSDSSSYSDPSSSTANGKSRAWNRHSSEGRTVPLIRSLVLIWRQNQ